MIPHHPVLEGLVAFAIVFLIGFLFAKSKDARSAVFTRQEVART